MPSKCVRCGANLTDQPIQCPTCGSVTPADTALEAKPARKRLSIPFAVILSIGLGGALVAGVGKPGTHRTADDAVVIDGPAAQLGGPAIGLLERHVKLGPQSRGR